MKLINFQDDNVRYFKMKRTSQLNRHIKLYCEAWPSLPLCRVGKCLGSVVNFQNFLKVKKSNFFQKKISKKFEFFLFCQGSTKDWDRPAVSFKILISPRSSSSTMIFVSFLNTHLMRLVFFVWRQDYVSRLRMWYNFYL